jgi:hypothetical protein
MAVTMPWAEEIVVGMSLGFPVNVFTLDDPILGVLDEAILDGALVAQPVTQFAQVVSINRGRSPNQNETQAGVATIVLNNNDRRFDPINEDSPYWDTATNTSGVQPRRFVEITSNGEHLFQGAITAINISYDTNFSTCTIEASDDFTRLANMTIATAFTPPVQISGNRVTTILDLPEVNYPNDQRVIETGGKDLQALQIDAGTNVLSYLQQCALADQALLFMDRTGNIVYTDPVGTVWNYDIAATFTDSNEATGVIPYTGISTITDQTFLYNRIVTSKDGGIEYVVDDVASQTSYGIQTYSLTNLLLNENADAEALATELLNKYKNPAYRFDDMQFVLNGLTTANQTVMATLDIGDNIKIVRTFATGAPLTVELYYQVERVSHEITTGQHTCTIGLGSLKTLIYQFILDDATYGTLDTSNALA